MTENLVWIAVALAAIIFTTVVVEQRELQPDVNLEESTNETVKAIDEKLDKLIEIYREKN